MKRNKKSKKAHTVPLSHFLAGLPAPPQITTFVGPTKQKLFKLPTAPRANRALDHDDSIPVQPPYVAFINNLPFDADEREVRDMFHSLDIQSLRLPREDRFSRRTRGFAYLEFNTREELITLLRMEEPTLRGRRVRIEVSNDHDSYYLMPGCSDGGDYNVVQPKKWKSTKAQLYGQNQACGDHEYNMGYNSENDSQLNGNFDREFPILNTRPRSFSTMTIMAEGREQLSQPQSPPNESSCPSLSQSTSSLTERIFGLARPVDTAAREREIDERLEHERLAHQRLQQLADYENANPTRQSLFGEIRPPQLHFFRNI